MNTVRSGAIADLIAEVTRGAGKGTALFLGGQQGMNPRYNLTAQQRDFIAAVKAMPKRDLRPAHRHPAKQSDPEIVRRGDKPLTPVEIAWLQNLPTDPAAMHEDDAVALGTLARTLTYGSTDSRLVNAKWRPVAEYHDGLQREVDQANAKVPMPGIPSSALGALADAVAEENPSLTYPEALTRAGTAIDEAVSRQSLATAQAAVAAAS